MTQEEAIETLLSNRSVNFLVGQVMKKSQGRANPQLVKKLIIKEIIYKECLKYMNDNPPDLGVEVVEEVATEERN